MATNEDDKLELPGMGKDHTFKDEMHLPTGEDLEFQVQEGGKLETLNLKGTADITISDYLFSLVKEIIVSERDWHLDRLVFLQQKIIDLKRQGFDI